MCIFGICTWHMLCFHIPQWTISYAIMHNFCSLIFPFLSTFFRCKCQHYAYSNGWRPCTNNCHWHAKSIKSIYSSMDACREQFIWFPCVLWWFCQGLFCDCQRIQREIVLRCRLIGLDELRKIIFSSRHRKRQRKAVVEHRKSNTSSGTKVSILFYLYL